MEFVILSTTKHLDRLRLMATHNPNRFSIVYVDGDDPEQKEGTTTACRVLVEFPRMVTPFSTTEPFKADDVTGEPPKKRNKTLTHALTVDFRGEEPTNELGQFREFQRALQERLEELCTQLEDKGRRLKRKKRTEANRGTNVFSLIRPRKGKFEDWPDVMVLKFVPGNAAFTWGEAHRKVDVASEDLADHVVEPVAQLADVFKFTNGLYYPRYLLRRCHVHDETKDFSPDTELAWDADDVQQTSSSEGVKRV